MDFPKIDLVDELYYWQDYYNRLQAYITRPDKRYRAQRMPIEFYIKMGKELIKVQCVIDNIKTNITKEYLKLEKEEQERMVGIYNRLCKHNAQH